jgi:hypothetical protein
MTRRLGCSLVIGLLVWAGCAGAPGPLRKLPAFGKNAEEQALRKQVEADPFPSAKQAGL